MAKCAERCGVCVCVYVLMCVCVCLRVCVCVCQHIVCMHAWIVWIYFEYPSFVSLYKTVHNPTDNKMFRQTHWHAQWLIIYKSGSSLPSFQISNVTTRLCSEYYEKKSTRTHAHTSVHAHTCMYACISACTFAWNLLLPPPPTDLVTHTCMWHMTDENQKQCCQHH